MELKLPSISLSPMSSGVWELALGTVRAGMRSRTGFVFQSEGRCGGRRARLQASVECQGGWGSKYLRSHAHTYVPDSGGVRSQTCTCARGPGLGTCLCSWVSDGQAELQDSMPPHRKTKLGKTGLGNPYTNRHRMGDIGLGRDTNQHMKELGLGTDYIRDMRVQLCGTTVSAGLLKRWG